jgi:hypothetical protein
MHLFQKIHKENPNDKMPAHPEGCDRNLPFETQIRSLRMSNSLDGVTGVPVAGHHLMGLRVPRSGRLLPSLKSGFTLEP